MNRNFAGAAGMLLGLGLETAVFAQEAAAPAGPDEALEAGQAFPDGLWVFGDTCAAAALDLVEDGIVLTRKGTQAPESRCDFVKLMPGGENRWAVVELCTGRDSTFARLSSLVILQDGRALLASESGGELEFDRCPDPEPEAETETEAGASPEAESAPDEPTEAAQDEPVEAEEAPADAGAEGTGN